MVLGSVYSPTSLCLWCLFFFSSRRRHTRCALVTGVQTCALPISCGLPPLANFITYDRANSVFVGLRVIFFNRLVGSIRIARHRIALCQPCKAMILFLKIDGVAAFNRLLVQLRPRLVAGTLGLGLFGQVRQPVVYATGLSDRLKP